MLMFKRYNKSTTLPSGWSYDFQNWSSKYGWLKIRHLWDQATDRKLPIYYEKSTYDALLLPYCWELQLIVGIVSIILR